MANTEAPNTLLSNTTMRVMDLLCEGPISGFTYKATAWTGDPLLSTYYSDVPVRNLDGSYNYNVSGAGFNFQYMLGTSTQTGIPGFQKVESIIALGANTLVSNPPVGAGPYKTVVAAFNTQMYPDADSVKVTMRVPALFSQDDQGNTNGYNVGYAIDVALNDGPFVTWDASKRAFNASATQTDTFNGKCTVPYLRDHVIVLPKTTPAGSYYSWKVRVRRTTTDIQSIRTQNAIYVDNMSLISSSLYAYPNSVMVATEISANQFSDIPARSYDVYGTLVSVPNGYTPTQYDLSGNFLAAATYPTVWTGDFKAPIWTDNPAWIFYDLLTNPVRGLGDYIPSGAVDKWTLYQLAQYCDQLVDNGASGLYGTATLEPRFTCNVSIQQPEQAYSALLNLASTFRGMLYYANGTIHPVSTNDMQSPVYAFNNSNVINGTFSYSDTANSTRSTVAAVKYTDPKNGWRDNVAYVEDTDGILRYGYNEKQMSAFACTTQGQAYRLGAWTLETERLLTETVTFQTSMEGLYIMPGDVFAVYDNFRNNRTQAGRVQSRSTGGSQIWLDRPVALDAGITYSLTCITPEYVLDSGSITGSNQIPLLRNPQIQSFRVTDAATTSIQQLTVAGQFSSGLYVGSPWILSASGNTGIFNKASFYTCLATSEIEPGQIEVLGLQASTGITFTISTGYTVIDQPPNEGNSAAISPPTNFVSTWVTGALADNTFFSNIELTWTDSPSSNLASYAWSGQTPGFVYTGYSTIGPAAVFPVQGPGTYNFRVAAISDGGIYSTFASAAQVIPNSNPFGVSPPLSGVFIFQDADALYANQTTFAITGYIGAAPGLEWNFQQDASRGTDTPAYDLITGYRIRISGFNGVDDYLSGRPIIIEGRENSQYVFPNRFLYTGVSGGARRGFDFWVDTLDQYGGISTGGRVKINNEPPGPPLNSGFVGYNGGIYYEVTPAINNDLSGIWIWYNTSPSFTPTFQNANYVSDNMAGLVTNSIYQTTNYYAWYSLTDTFGYTGCPIYGPIAIDPNGSVSGAYFNLNQRIDSVSATTSGVSGYVNAQVATVMTALATTGSALAQWLTYMSVTATGVTSSVTILASAGITGAVNGVGGAPLARWGFTLQNVVGGVASIAGVEAVLTGSYSQNIGTLKFTNLKLQSDTYSAGSAGWAINTDGSVDFNNITGRGTLQSSTYTPGSAGWQINRNGNAEFNNVVARGSFTGGAGTSVAAIDVNGLTVGDPSATRINLQANNGSFNLYRVDGVQTALIGNVSDSDAAHAFGRMNLYSGNSTPWVVTEATRKGLFRLGDGTINMFGDNGSINCDILDVDTTSNFDGAVVMGDNFTMNGVSKAFDITNGTVNGRWGVNNSTNRLTWGTTTNHTIEVYTNNSIRWFFSSDGNFKSNGFDIRKVTSDGWTTPLYDGASSLEFQASAGQIYGRINGGAAILLG